MGDFTERPATWPYSPIGASAWKRTDRLGVPRGEFAEVIGVDGSQENGARPHPGFEFIQELAGTLVGGDSADRECNFFQQITLRVGDTTFVDGFVYRVVATTATGGKVVGKSSRVFFKWRAPGAVAYEADTAIERNAVDRLDGDQPMSLIVNGAYCYVMVAGAEPTEFHLTAPGAAANIAINTDTGPGVGPFIAQHNPPIASITDAPASNYYDPATTASSPLFKLGKPGGNEEQEVELTGNPTGGNFTLTVFFPNGTTETTGVIAWNATAATVQTALEALAGIGVGDVAVTGGPGPNDPWIVKFQGALAGYNLPEMRGNPAGLTGGISPGVNVTTTDEPPGANVKVFTFSFYDTTNTPPTKVTAPLKGPSDIGAYLVNAGGIPTDPIFDKFVAHKLLRGNSLNFAPSNIPDEATDSRVVDGGKRPAAVDTHRKYGLCVQLFDSRTGRYSTPSKIIEVNPIGTGEEPFRSPEFSIQAKTGTDSTGAEVTSIYQVTGGYRSAWLAIEIVYDSNKWGSVLVYRTIAGLPKGPLHIDSDFKNIFFFRTTSQTDPATGANFTDGWVRAFVFLRTPEPFIATQASYDGASFVLDLDMPRAGSAIMHEGTLFVGNIGRVDKDASGMGLIRWSAMSRQSVEAFSPLSRYVLELPGEEIQRFAKLGGTLVGISKENTYIVKKVGVFPAIEPLFDNIGIVATRAACSVGASTYLVSPQGLYTMNATRGVEAVAAIRSLLVKDWLSTQSSIQMAFDTEAKIICILNTSTRQSCLLYLETSRVVTLEDTPFVQLADGPCPDNAAVAGGVQKRACFLQTVHPTSSSTRFRVWVIDSDRDKGIQFTSHPDNGQRMIRTLQPRGAEARQVVAADFTSGVNLTVNNPGLDGSGGATAAIRLEGCVLYVAAVGANGNRALIGRRARIVRATINLVGGAHTFELEAADAPNLHGLLAGDSLWLSPVPVRLVGHIPWLESSEEGVQTPFAGRNYSRQRKITAMRVAMADVAGPPTLTVVGTGGGNGDATTLNRWAALVYKGNDADPEVLNGTSRFFPQKLDRATAIAGAVRSIKNGPSNDAAAYNEPHGGYVGAAIFPAFETLVPDMDYQLTEIIVDGNIEGTDREARGSA